MGFKIRRFTLVHIILGFIDSHKRSSVGLEIINAESAEHATVR